MYHTSLRDVSTVEPLVLPDLRYKKLTKFQRSGLLLFEKYSFVGISRREDSGYARFSADIELSKSWQTDTGLLVSGTGNILTAAYIENKVNEESHLLKVYPMGALEFKYPLVKNELKKSQVFIPIAQLVYSTDTSPLLTQLMRIVLLLSLIVQRFLSCEKYRVLTDRKKASG